MNLVRKFTTLAVLSACFIASAADPVVIAPQTPLSQIFWGYVFPILLSLVFVIYGGASAAAHIRLQAAAKTSKVAAALEEFLICIDHAVAHVNSDIRPKLSSSMADGSLSTAEATQLKDTAIDIAKSQLLPETLVVVKEHLGPGFSTWVSGAVETALSAQQATTAEKQANAAVAVTETAVAAEKAEKATA